jgi:hypothetical protein
MDIKKKQARHAKESLFVPLLDDEAAGVRMLARTAIDGEKERVFKTFKTKLEEAEELGLITAKQLNFLVALLVASK